MQNVSSVQIYQSLSENVVVLGIIYMKFMKCLIRHFLLRVVSAEFQTSRSEARQQRKPRKLPLLGSCPHNLPSSVKIVKMLTHGNSEMLAMTLLFTTQTVTNKTIL